MRFLIAAFVLLSPPSLLAAKKDSTPVATVNGTVITKETLERIHTQNLLYVSNKTVTKKKTLDDLINRVLGIQKAKKANLQNDPVVKEKMEDVLYHAQISKDLESELKKITVKDREVENYYRRNPEYRTAHILFRVRARPEKEEWKAALLQAKKVYLALTKNPDKFAEYAAKYSQSSNASQGGEMGFQPAVRLAPEYYRALKGRAKGAIIAPVRTQFGYHIIKVIAVKKFKDINKPMYKKIVYDTKRDKILKRYFTGLRKGASVKVHAKLD